MEFSIASLLASFPDEKSIAPKALEKRLGCETEQDLQRFQIALDALEKIGLLVKERGRYRRVQEEGLVEAKLRCSSKGFCFAIQCMEGAEDIYIREGYLNSAWNGDRVLVKILKEGSRRRRPEGEVRLILERANPSILARVKKTDAGFRAVPLDDRLLFELELQPNGDDLGSAVEHIVDVRVERYPLGNCLPLGKVAQVLGRNAEVASDIDIVSCKHDLPKAFAEELVEAAKRIKGKIRAAEIKRRLDLRDRLTLSFSREPMLMVSRTSEEGEQKPESLSLGAGNLSLGEHNRPPVEHGFTLELLRGDDGRDRWQVGVHVTDVAYHIEPDSPLDREAVKRGISVYLGNIILPMFPEPVAEALSLLEQEERLAWSIFITLDLDAGEIADFELQPSVVRVDYCLSFSQAQAILDSQEGSETEGTPLDEVTPPDVPSEVVEAIADLVEVAKALREFRWQRGAFDLSLPPELDNHFDDEGSLGATCMAPLAIQTAIAELSILANQTMAKHLLAWGVPALYRVQPSPDPEDVEDLLKLGAQYGVEMDISEEETVRPQDYQRFLTEVKATPGWKVLMYQLRSTLKPGGYSTLDGFHFGLALQGYTHFTSPLQRYSDLLVQRLLDAVVRLGRDRRSTRSKEKVDLFNASCHGQITWNVLPPDAQGDFEALVARMAGHLSDREQLAVEAETDLIGLQKTAVVKESIGKTFEGLITGVQSYGFFVEIEVEDANIAQASRRTPLRLEGLVHVNSLKDDWYEYRSRQQTLVGRKNRRQFRLGDRVGVEVKNVDYYRQQIDLVVVSGGSKFSPTPGNGYDDSRSNYSYEEE